MFLVARGARLVRCEKTDGRGRSLRPPPARRLQRNPLRDTPFRSRLAAVALLPVPALSSVAGLQSVRRQRSPGRGMRRNSFCFMARCDTLRLNMVM